MRIAMCFYGLADGHSEKTIDGKMWDGKKGERTPIDWRIGFEHNKRHILDENNNIDVFMHSWSTSSEEDLIEAYGPKLSKFEKQVSFGKKFSKEHITKSRWYSLKESVALKRRHEKHYGFTYDMVMVCRFDLAWSTNLIFKDFDPSFFHVQNCCIMRSKKTGKIIHDENFFFKGWDKGEKSEDVLHTHEGWTHKTPTIEGLADYWFFSGSKNIDKFSDLFDSIDRFAIRHFPSSHKFASLHLGEIGLLPKVKFVFHIYNDCHLVRHVYHGWRSEQ